MNKPAQKAVPSTTLDSSSRSPSGEGTPPRRRRRITMAEACRMAQAARIEAQEAERRFWEEESRRIDYWEEEE